MSEQLVVIRTFSTELEASSVQAALAAAGIQSLVLAGGEPASPLTAMPAGIGLAVHSRDVDRAEEVLSPPPPTAG